MDFTAVDVIYSFNTKNNGHIPFQSSDTLNLFVVDQ